MVEPSISSKLLYHQGFAPPKKAIVSFAEVSTAPVEHEKSLSSYQRNPFQWSMSIEIFTPMLLWTALRLPMSYFFSSEQGHPFTLVLNLDKLSPSLKINFTFYHHYRVASTGSLPANSLSKRVRPDAIP